MVTLTNMQAQGFNANVIGQLFADSSRAFPIADCFRLTDMIQQAQDRQKAYRDQAKKIIDSHKGIADSKTGKVTYPNDEAQAKAIEDINLLNETTFEIMGDKVKITEEWPKLTLIEMTILKPLITMG